MGWRTIVVNQHSKLSYKNNHLVYKDAYQTELIHLSEIDVLILETTDIVISTMLIKRLTDENVVVIFCNHKRLPITTLIPFSSRHDSSLQLAKQVAWKEDIKALVWTSIISQKIYNQSLLLGEYSFYEKSQSIMELHRGLDIFDPTNREGHAARIYFNTLFGNDFSRELDNDINAALDYGYSLILSLFAREIVKNGCMTQFGLKHSNQFNHYNLASDLMEPYRVIIDRIVYQNRDSSFTKIKKELLTIFSDTYSYNNKDMYLTNIVADYTKKVLSSLHEEIGEVPAFII